MERNKVWCVVGEHTKDLTPENHLSKINFDDYCDFAMLTMVIEGGSNPFTNNKYTWFFDKARDATKASFALVTPERILVSHLKNAKNTLKGYWNDRKIRHYGVLDLEHKPWSSEQVLKTVEKTFNLLKASDI
ncbi:hypothetical protein HPB48_016791 [Haemaphysalis longicornis]|uniref:Uncharacterized protein n=1 Tax=Haemaphysalis longicornis TaxID=44386 RepID=A0A9J6GG34_HAELO|nr:hypothetical protein HPB48_016791 [Haemaphysalis longicornis]